MQTRPATPDDFPTILALNQEWVHYLSPLDAPRLQMLHAAAKRVSLQVADCAPTLVATGQGEAVAAEVEPCHR